MAIEVTAEIVPLDLARGIAHQRGDHFRHRGAVIVAAARYVERPRQPAVRIMHRRVHAADIDIAPGEMLIAVNDHGLVFVKAGADAVGAFLRLAPPRALYQTRRGEGSASASFVRRSSTMPRASLRMTAQPERPTERNI
jgi:hypothetical protein